jgi:catechol 2,3-dioxygenase-like lactoylglutathione lyase family enzyme
LPEAQSPTLVPELLVADIEASLSFWCNLCGFEVVYDRPEEGFAYIARGSAHVMLEQVGFGRNWVTAPLDPPLGRGINFQISVPDLAPILHALNEAGWPLFMEPEERWYQVSSGRAGVVQVLVQDPDGYLIRMQARSEP